MLKQIFHDLLIVIAFPGLIVFGYFYFRSDEGMELFTTSSRETMARPGEGGVELGVKTKTALAELKSINFDDSIFSDPSFLSLVDFTEEINPTPIGRDYPFNPPDELRYKARLRTGKVDPVVKNESSVELSKKLDALVTGKK